uniref:SLC26A/SulP transporter domain-containing protein n=2 Tax=Stomoxys calcitrans TaxID=35570 RepID=A0A1I8Q315_STOCA
MNTVVRENNAIDFTNVVMVDHQTVTNSRQSLADSNANLDDSPPAGGGGPGKCRPCMDNMFNGKILKRHMPIFQWLPAYSREDFVGDLIAGITDSLAAIPLALAFAGIAGLPTEFALYSSFMGNIVYTIFGSCKDNIVGSTAIASLLTFQVAQGDWQKSVLFSLLTGVIELVMGLTRLGFIIDFVSGPVNAGFTSAVALIIFTSQIKNILVVQSTGDSFLENWISMLKDIHNYRISDTVLGMSSIVILIVLRFIGNIKIKPPENGDLSREQRMANTIFWFVGVARNALLVFITATIVGYLQLKDYFQLTGYIPSGFPPVEIPAFSLPGSNVTQGFAEDVGEQQTFWMLLKEFGTGLLVIPLISLLETMAVCRTFAKGKPVDTNQELISLGLANIFNTFFRGYRINGGLARGSVNTASGGRTQFVNVYISLIVILAMIFLAEYFYYIPIATLAAIIIAAVLFQLQYQTIKPMWRSNKADLFIGLLAFTACLVAPLSAGVFAAIFINILYILYQSARPEIAVDLVKTSSGKYFLKITPDRCLIFPSMEFVRNKVLKSGKKNSTLPVVFDCTYIYATDFTTAKAIELILQDFKSRNQLLIFFNLRPRLVKVFETIQSKFILCYTMDDIEKSLREKASNGNACNVTEETNL